MPQAYNGYVLDLCVQHSWVNAEQKSSIDALLLSNPNLSAIDVLMEQQIVSQEVIDWLRLAVDHQFMHGRRLRPPLPPLKSSLILRSRPSRDSTTSPIISCWDYKPEVLISTWDRRLLP